MSNPQGAITPCPECGSYGGFAGEAECPNPYHRTNASSRVRCPKCGEWVDLPADGLPLDPSDTKAVDFVMTQVVDRLVQECPAHA